MTIRTIDRANLRPEHEKRHVSRPETRPERAKSETDRPRFPLPVVISTREQKKPGRNTGRAIAPFLAQLFLQYDTIDVTRQIRRERLENASRSYNNAMVMTGQRDNKFGRTRWA